MSHFVRRRGSFHFTALSAFEDKIPGHNFPSSGAMEYWRSCSAMNPSSIASEFRRLSSSGTSGRIGRLVLSNDEDFGR
ncbi:hypothetical protein DPMN_115991 [Dreissena polymorpha]|uniref:Uncharacterized protein n=1 Tax=Dreissena polymorpha TaxID=45954 RepID=A0A9D4KM88_DREPO|nr:hypothetical protein DPMN_115991 [Dreissena polymorpha]